jgi:hypothetical protein
MNAPKVQASDYSQFLIAAQRVYSCLEAGKVSPEVAAHDAYNPLICVTANRYKSTPCHSFFRTESLLRFRKKDYLG